MRLLSCLLVLLASAAAAAREDAPRRRAQAFLIPMDEGARIPVSRVAKALQDVLLHTPAYEVVDLGRALSVQSTAEQAQHAERGRGLLAEGGSAAASRGWPEAAAKYRQALRELDEGLPAVDPREYAAAVLRLATAVSLSGGEAAARDLFALAVRLDPRRRLVADEAVAPQLEQARADLTGARRCALEVDVRPAGARIFLDGELRGQHVEAPAGRHLLRVERPGFYPYAALIELAPKKPLEWSITLAATPTAASLGQVIAGAADEVGRGGAGESVSALAQKFSLERVLIGSVRSREGARVSVLLALVDTGRHQVIGAKTLSLVADGTDADQVEADTQAAARRLIAADGEEPAPAPLAAAPAAPGDPALPADGRRVLIPADAPAPAAKEAVRRERKRPRGLQGKTGTEEWGDD